MAISLGDINFALGADAADLQRSLSRLKAFGKEVERVSRSQVDGADKVAAAYRKQEAAITSALQKTLNLTAAIRRAGGDDAMVRKVTDAFSLYNNQLSNTAVKSLTLQRANQRLNASFGDVKRQLDDIKKRQSDQMWSRFALQFQNMAAAAALISGPLGGVAARITILGSVLSRSGAAAAAFYGGIALGALGLYSLGAAMVENTRKLNVAESGFMALTNSVEETNRLMNEAKIIANRSGQTFVTVAQQYSKFLAAARGTNLAGEKSAQIFDTVAQTVGKLQLPTEQAEGVFRALEQMMSKGTIQAEELRGQLGDRLPGAFNIMAEALGVSTAKLNDMLKAGDVLADEALPKFAEQLKKTFNLNGDVDNFQASVNRVKNAWSFFLLELDKTAQFTNVVKNVLDLTVVALDALRAAVRWTADTLDEFGLGFDAAIGWMLKFANTVGNIAVAVYEGFKGMFGRVGELFDAFITDIAEFVADPLGSGGFDTLSAALDKGFVNAFTDAFEKVRVEGREFNKAIDEEISARADAIAANRAKRAQADAAGGLFGFGSPRGGSGGGEGLSAKEMAKRAEALAKVNQQMERLQLSVEALSSGGQASLEKLNKEFERQDKIDDFAKMLREAGLSAAEANRRLDEYSKTLEKFDVLTAEAQAQQEALKELEGVASRAFDRIGSALTNFVSKGKLDFSEFRGVLKAVVDDILQTMLMLTVINPIKNAIFGDLGGGLAPTIGSIGGSGGGFGNILSGIGSFLGFAKDGMAFGGGVRRMAKGGLLQGPTMFGSAGGPVVGGELGTEAIMPLARNSRGQLGVMAASNDNASNFNVYYTIDARGADIEAVNRIEKAVRKLDSSVEARALAATKDARVRNSRMLK